MGSDHYCLRWNNHQSNLLGVFSQLLRDESLVDVTLACSEGHSIRAHKVVLSACSSYFQTLFIDHPARHPIVILKDVRFAELSTLIEFMYHGEVNVEHCQLSELLRTAESLKVKGLTDMGTTNLPAVGLQLQQQQQTTQANKVQIQASSQHGSNTYNTSSSTSTSTSSGTTTTCCKTEPPPETMAEPEQTEPTELINKPTKPPTSISTSLSSAYRDKEELINNPMITAGTTCLTTTTMTTTTSSTAAAASLSVTPISLVSSERRSTTNLDHPMGQQHKFHMPPMENPLTDISNNKNSPNRLVASPQAGSSIESETLRPDSDIDEDLDESDGESVDYKPSDMRLLTTETSNLNRHDGNSSSVNSVRHSDAILGGNSVGIGIAGILGRLPSPIVVGAGEPIAGPSSIMPPVQQVPLSLKKEVDWGGGSADEKSNIDSPSDYPRHSLDPDPTSSTTTSEGLIQQAAAAILQQASTSSSTNSSSHQQQLYQCIYCNTAFPHQSKLTRHILSHSLETLKYREQQLAGQHSPLLNIGQQVISEVNSPLNLMEQSPQTPMDIDALSASNLNETPGVVLCKFCGKSFPDVSSLIGHLPVHTGDRPFKCEFCGKAFKLRHHMKDHCRVHTGERPFRCSLCGKTFSRSTILKAHEKTHYPKYVRKFLSPSPLDTEEESPH